MSQQRDGLQETTGASDDATVGGSGSDDATRDNEEHELAAEQESAEAMDADVPHPPDDSEANAG